MTGRLGLRTRRGRGSALVVIGLYAGLLGAMAGSSPAGAARAAHAQANPSTTADNGGSSGPATTTANLLRGTATTRTPTTVPGTTSPSTSHVADDNRRVWLVVAGLVLVAVLLALLTAWYWVRTKPARVAEAIGAPRPRSRPTVPAGASVSGARSSLGPDRLPPDLEESEAFEPASSRGPVRPRPSQREAALRRARDLTR